MTFELVRHSDDLRALAPEQRVKALKRAIPAYVREAAMDCRGVIDYYLQITECEYWRDVANSEEAYFLEYCKKPKAWFEAIKTLVELEGQP